MLSRLSGRVWFVLLCGALVLAGALGAALWFAAVFAVEVLTWPGVVTLLAAEACVAVGAVLDYREARLEPPTRLAAWLVAHYTVVRRVYRRGRWAVDGVKARRRAATARAAAQARRDAVGEDQQRGREAA